MPTLKERVDRHDREIAAIRKLLMTGAKMLVKSDQNLLRLEGEQLALRKELRELAVAQRELKKEMQAFLRSLRGGGNGNGHLKRRVD